MSSSALLDELMSGFVAAQSAWSDPTPAKAANHAKSQHVCDLAVDPAPCEEPRKSANDSTGGAATAASSHPFAALRNSTRSPQSKRLRGSSQVSQDSQGPLEAVHCGHYPAPADGTDPDIARFFERRARLLRWGWTEPEAEQLAERLMKRDVEQDDRVSCTDCRHYRPGRCGNHRRAGLNVGEVCRDLATLLQRCSGFQEIG